MPTARPGPWLDQAVERGLIRAAETEVRAPAPAPPPGCSEKAFTAAVVALAGAHGWEPYHTHDSRRSQPGFPDLVLVRPPALILAELKVGANAPTPDQDRWLALLGAVPGVRVRLWRPEGWPAIAAELAEGGAA